MVLAGWVSVFASSSHAPSFYLTNQTTRPNLLSTAKEGWEPRLMNIKPSLVTPFIFPLLQSTRLKSILLKDVGEHVGIDLIVMLS
jgi:hypothetical protein